MTPHKRFDLIGAALAREPAGVQVLDRQGSFDKAVWTKPLAYSRLCISNGIVTADGAAGAGGDVGTNEPEHVLQASKLNGSAVNVVAMR